jgi:hypothetical protein
MSLHSTPDSGTTVAFLNTDPACTEVFRRGVASGPAVHDPRTDQDWIPVVCPDHSRLLVHERLVFEDPAAGPPLTVRLPKTPDAVRDAVTRWTCRVVMLAGAPAPPWVEIATTLENLLTALSPMRATMRALAPVDPSGELVDVVLRLAEATWQLNENDIGAARNALAAAADALARHLTASG